jgi:hypothetical protein
LFANLKGSFAFQNSSMSSLNISQLYVHEWGLAVGRKLQDWSHADEAWHLGQYQPQFSWNPLLPESQGLTGIFMELPGPNTDFPWGLRAFGSAIYIPDQGASYNMKDGQFVEDNPWFSPPPKHIQYDDKGQVVDTLNYNVLKPQTNEIIFNSSYAAQFYAGKKDQGFSTTAALAYMPSNQLALGLGADVKTAQTTNVQITPKIFYHSLASADARWASASGVAVGLGILREKPSDPEFAADQTYKTYAESFLTSPYLEAKLGPVLAEISYLDIQGGESTVKGPKADKFSAILPERYAFQKAGQLALKYNYFWKKSEGIRLSTSYLQGEKVIRALDTT